MTNIVVLNSQSHRELRVQAEATAKFGDNQRFVPVVITEIPLLVTHYPVLFSKDADTGAFFCGAMLGIDEGENLFLKEGKGHEGYRPLNLQRAPFFVSGDELAIDLDHLRISADKGQSLFDENGEPTPYLESIKAAFQQLKPGNEMTKRFIETLLKLNLLARFVSARLSTAHLSADRFAEADSGVGAKKERPISASRCLKVPAAFPVEISRIPNSSCARW
jgi:hypothetical protein